jgi:hypothetical protein
MASKDPKISKHMYRSWKKTTLTIAQRLEIIRRFENREDEER